MASLTQRLYEVAPVWAQNLGINLFGFTWRNKRFGGRFEEHCAAYTEREGYSKVQWDEYQNERLRELLLHAMRNVPYYREAFAQRGLTEREVSRISRDELVRLPTVGKDDIRSAPQYFLEDGIDRAGLLHFKTSGTTGTPLTVMYPLEVMREWMAAREVRCHYWSGTHKDMSRATFGGRIVVPEKQEGPPYWRYNRVERQLYMSAFHVSPQTAPLYVDALNRYQPDFLAGYTASHFFLARFIKEQGLQVHQPKALVITSEKLTDEMRDTFWQVYGCPAFDTYSGVELCCLASDCEHHRMHLSPDVGLVEILDEKGNPVPAGEPGEIVATGLLNYSQPLIRYRTGDLAVLATEPCPCGRQMPVIEELVGRLEDTVVGPDGREMVRFHGIYYDLPHVRAGQVIQEALSEFRLRLEVLPGFSEDERRLIRDRFRERLGEIDLSIEVVEEIERTERGKFKAVISKVGRDVNLRPNANQ